MCITPSSIWVQRGGKWVEQPVRCKRCWLCKQNRVDDYVGRALCEASTSRRSCTVNLTYAPRQDLADKVLHPRHFQLFMKLLRRAGHSVRYLVAGEYGEMKGRAHFHAILFFSDFGPEAGPIPAYNAPAPFREGIANKRMVHLAEWPHGHATVDWTATPQAIRYVCKYLLADDKKNAWFSLSKKPPLGAEWFARKAQMARNLGVLPSGFTYVPPGMDKPVMMSGATRRDYLNAITQDPADIPRMSEWCAKVFEKHERERLVRYIAETPLEEAVASFADRIQSNEDNRMLREYFRRERETMRLADMLANSGDTCLRRLRGQWVPESVWLKEQDHGTQEASR